MLYIHEINDHEQAEAYYGPFHPSEIDVRINDNYAEALESLGGELTAVSLTKEEAAKFYISPREFWIEQLANLS